MSLSQSSSPQRVIDVGPAGFHPPSAMELGVTHPDSGFGLLYGRLTGTQIRANHGIERLNPRPA